MVTEKFRRQLRQESEQWWAEGLIDAELYQHLSDRYQFSRLEADASNRFIVTLMGLGSVLLGLAAITFVAANWQAWSRDFKLLLLISLFIGINAVGFYMWRLPSQRGYQKLGHSLLLLGALVLGANLGLTSQMFHHSGSFAELLLVWGLGVLAMAHSLRLVSLGILSLILVSLGYAISWVDGSFSQVQSSWLQQAVEHLPLLVSLLYIPLAHRCRSRSIFGLSAVLIAISLPFSLAMVRGVNPWGTGVLAAIALTLPASLLWVYRFNFWSAPRDPNPASDLFQPISQALALCGLGFLFSVAAFRGFWESSLSSSATASILPLHWLPLIDAAVLLGVAGLGWFQLSRQRHQAAAQVLNSSVVAGLIAIATVTFAIHAEITSISLPATIIFNGLLFGLAIGLIRDGLALGERRPFWGGMLLLVLGIICRMLEYDTGLLLKSVIFALCGIGVMAAGLWFEQKIKPRHPSAQS
ncbi:DUF2157 domain-containing protein [Phormidium tenue FACHB-886]|nr:DUF2157 domain-containing protein [Phormidium tenue FACHB-886]